MPKIAIWISFAGWLGLLAALFLAGTALLNPSRGVPGYVAALGYAPQILGALLTIGAAEGLAYLAGIERELVRARTESADMARSLRTMATAPAHGAHPSSEMLAKATYNGWTVAQDGEIWRVTRTNGTGYSFPTRAALDVFLDSLPAAR